MKSACRDGEESLTDGRERVSLPWALATVRRDRRALDAEVRGVAPESIQLSTPVVESAARYPRYS